MLTYYNGSWHINYNFANDLALGRAQGVQEFLEARRTVIFHWDDHYARLISSCSVRSSIWLEKLPPKAEIEKRASRLLGKYELDESLVRILVTPGDSHDTKTSLGYPTLSLDIKPFPVAPTKPLKLKTVRARREFPQCKFTAGYGYADIYEAEARARGFDKFLYWDEREGILEGAYENIFFVSARGILVTPQDHVLLGITRKIVLDRSHWSGICRGVLELPQIHMHELNYCREAFLTSTTLGVAEVEVIDDKAFKTHTLTRKIRKDFLDYRERYYKERGA